MEPSTTPEPSASPAQSELSLFARMFLAQIFSLAGVVVILFMQVVMYLFGGNVPRNASGVSYVHIASEDILIAALILGLALICIQYAVLAKWITHQRLWLLFSALLAAALLWGIWQILYSQGFILTKVITCTKPGQVIDQSWAHKAALEQPYWLAGLLGAAAGLILGAVQARFLRELRWQWCLLSPLSMGIVIALALFFWNVEVWGVNLVYSRCI